MNLKVSIIIPYFNHGEFILNTLNSVYKQLYSNIEIILVNDSSTDKKSIEVFNLIDNPLVKKFTIPNGGPCTAKNFGVKEASGDIIGFLDSDNEFLDGYVLGAVNALNNIEIDWFYGDAEYFGDKTGVRKQELKGKEEIFINSPVDNCIFIRKQTFTKLGGFDEYLNFLGLEDWEFILRLIINDKRFVYLPKPMFKYRVIKSSRSFNEAKKHKNKIEQYVFNKHSESNF